jgi:glycosyltransferase involved in cell wall biosynthesis
MPHLYVNGRFLTRKMTGVERFAYNTCKAMAAMGQVFTIVCPQTPIDNSYDVGDLHVIHYGHCSSHFWEQCVLPFYLRGKKDSVLCSFTGLGSILVRQKVMTIHDLSFLENPRWFSKPYYWWYKLTTPLAARTSRRIITVSEFSKSEIRRFYPFVPSENIHVAYPAADTQQFTTLPNLPPPTERFALAVSSLDPRKNFSRLVEAFQGISDCKLYIAGNANRVFGGKEGTVADDNVKWLGRVSDDELLRLYNQAECFIFPSIYEGFGIPPVEAMACGCPVIASDIPVIREVCGDAALYFTPTDPKNIHDTICHYLEHSETLKPQLREKGFARCQRYSWEKTAEAVMEAVGNV